MAVMTKMRDNAHIFIIAFIVVFVAFWVISDLDIGAVMQGSQNEIGVIDGKAITYQEFQTLVEQVAEERRQQNNGQELDENALASIREQVWNDYITRAVIERTVEELNITVSDQEIIDWVRSDAPPEALARHFRDSTGAFNREQYLMVLENPGAENLEALVQIERQLRDELIRTKLTSALSSSVIVSDHDLRTKHFEQTASFSTSYILFDPRIVAATDTSAPTEEEYLAYYEKNKNQYKIKEMRKLKYVLFNEVPSASDSAAVRSELLALAEQAKSGADFLELVKNNSEQPYSDTWSSRQALQPNVADPLFDNPVGSIVGPLPNEVGLSLYKIMDARQGEETLVEASHILFRTDGGQDEAAQKAKAEKVLAEARSGQDFAALAAKHSEEPGAAERGGSLGWFGKGRMVAEFESAAMKAKVGEIVGPVKTMFGYHIVKVTGRSATEMKLAEIRLSVKASSRTRDELFEKARNFAYFASENGLEEEAKLNKLEVLETPEFAKQSGSYIPNIGVNPSLMKFSFENSIGTLSEVHRAANGYVVCMVSDKRSEGYRPLDEVKEQIKPSVVFERQKKKTLEFARKLSSGKSLQEISAANPSYAIQLTGDFTLATGPASVGRDEAFNGTILRLKEGETSKPFIGARGIYLVRLEKKSSFDETAFKVKKDELRQQAMQQTQNEFIQSWLDQQKEQISVTDNRDRFYR